MTRLRRPLVVLFTAVIAGSLAWGLTARAAPSKAAPPVGASTCATCHPKAYATWKRGPHAHALERLSDSERHEQRCLQCHSPDSSVGLEGVQCETCHGSGRYYFPDYVMRDPELRKLVGLVTPDAATCKRCHDASAPSLVPFDYAKKVERIRHWQDETGAPASAEAAGGH